LIDSPVVSVIVPTRALTERAALLRRALESLMSQEDVRVVPIVVINGRDRDRDLTRALQTDDRLRIAVLADVDLPSALRHGRQMVDSPFFAELDDDDIVLPRALTTRVCALDESADAQVVVSNGLRRDSRGETVHIADASIVHRDPLRALLSINWLLPGSWMCRTTDVDSSVFDGMPTYLACTYLAVRFATEYRMRFLECPTVVWHSDSPLSMYRSRENILGEEAGHRRILELDLPRDFLDAYRVRLSEAYHAIADLHLHEGCIREAWTWHWKSLRERGGARYLPFTRHLMRASWSVSQ